MTDLTAVPDPIVEAAAYQRFLLDALGADDPGDVQAGTVGEVRALLEEAGGHLRARPAPGEWSVLGCLGHLVDAEIVMSARYRFVVAQDEPPLVGYDQALWVERLDHEHDDPAALLALFETLRTANVAMWRRSTPQQRSRVGQHAERGPESYDLAYRMIGGHDRVHLAQARRALEAVRGTA
ncbi:MAG TPA: DinB family protein [Actinomycetota bacterium]